MQRVASKAQEVGKLATVLGASALVAGVRLVPCIIALHCPSCGLQARLLGLVLNKVSHQAFRGSQLTARF